MFRLHRTIRWPVVSLSTALIAISVLAGAVMIRSLWVATPASDVPRVELAAEPRGAPPSTGSDLSGAVPTPEVTTVRGGGASALESLNDALASANMRLGQADAGSVPAAIISADEAIAVARREFELGTPTISLGRLTVDGYHAGDETTPLAIEDRLVYVVQLTGLNMVPFGDDATSESMHHELVVFVDAVSGDYLIATTVR